LEPFVSAGGVVSGRRGRVELIVGVDEGKMELGVMVGLEELSDDDEAKPSVLLFNESNCGNVRGFEGAEMVEVNAKPSECKGDEEGEGWESVCGDEWISVALKLSSNWMRRSTTTLALRTDTVGSIGCRCMGIETKSVGPMAVVGASMLYCIRGARGLLIV